MLIICQYLSLTDQLDWTDPFLLRAKHCALKKLLNLLFLPRSYIFIFWLLLLMFLCFLNLILCILFLFNNIRNTYTDRITIYTFIHISLIHRNKSVCSYNTQLTSERLFLKGQQQTNHR